MTIPVKPGDIVQLKPFDEVCAVKEGLTKEELFDHIIEEYADTESCATVCFCKTSGNPDAPKVREDGNNTFLKKMYRWVNRLKNKEE